MKIIRQILNTSFSDKYSDEAESFDVIMPLLNSNFLFEENLRSIFTNIAVNRLLVGDGGCTDHSLEVLGRFPRVTIFDHSHYETQGASIVGLIREVKTEYFFYLHSDIYLENDDCVTSLLRLRPNADWIEGFRRNLILFEYAADYFYDNERSYSGMQLGQSEILKSATSMVTDGDLQRNEDIVIAELVKMKGGRYIKDKNSIHVHQSTNKNGNAEPKIKTVSIVKEEDILWEVKIYQIQIYGILKHLRPKPYLIKEVKYFILILKVMNYYTIEFQKKIEPFLQEWGLFINVRYAYLDKLRIIFSRRKQLSSAQMIHFLFS